MSYVEATARIAQLQSRMAQLNGLIAPVQTAASISTTGADFAATLDNLTAPRTTPLGTKEPSGIAPASSPAGQALASFAAQFVGTPYVAGGQSPETGWDCARFTQWSAQQMGITVPAVSWEQIKQGEQVPSIGDAQPGDFLFFHWPGGHQRDPSPLKVNHVGIYLGDGRMA